MVFNKFGHSPKTLRTDNGLEYSSREMRKYVASRGITLEYTAYTSEQNGRSERNIRTIVESARTLLHSKNLPMTRWAEAVNTAVYLLNRMTYSRTRGTTPFEIWMGKVPELSYLRIFGSEVFMHIPKQFRKKLNPKSKKMILVGYQGDSANYRLYDPVTKRISVTRDVVFNETTVYKTSSSRTSNFEPYLPRGEEIGTNGHLEGEPMEEQRI